MLDSSAALPIPDPPLRRSTQGRGIKILPPK